MLLGSTGGIHGRNVGEANGWVAAAQAFAQGAADVAGGAGDQNAIHGLSLCNAVSARP
jgi:hypothetical protein